MLLEREREKQRVRRIMPQYITLIALGEKRNGMTRKKEKHEKCEQRKGEQGAGRLEEGKERRDQ